MTRITPSMLTALARQINTLSGTPLEQFREPDPQHELLRINVGHHHYERLYGGWCLRRIVNDSGGDTDVLSAGYVPISLAFSLGHAYAAGIRAGLLMAQPQARRD